jgi:hypothetical protein
MTLDVPNKSKKRIAVIAIPKYPIEGGDGRNHPLFMTVKRKFLFASIVRFQAQDRVLAPSKGSSHDLCSDAGRTALLL